MTVAAAEQGGAPGLDQFAADVATALERTPRQLPSKYFYDALGSSLFEAISRLPWYRITRAESALLQSHGSEILSSVRGPFAVAELGCGNGEKLALFLEHAGRTAGDLHLVDISAAALGRACDRLRSVHHGAVRTYARGYEDGLARIAAERATDRPLVLLFLGSNIGNFDPPAAHALLAQMRASLREGDALLLGTDLVKPERVLLLAYDDPLGVTAAFNLNLLRRINDELGGTFDLDGFEHRACWNAHASRVEMHVVSRRRQEVRVAACRLALILQAGESIWTESSYKYEPADVVGHGRAAGFSAAAQWIDDKARFALTRFSV